MNDLTCFIDWFTTMFTVIEIATTMNMAGWFAYIKSDSLRA